MSKKFNYIVTDPCYLMPHEIWAEVCDKTQSETNDVFVEELTKHLPKGSVAHSTGVGDYINSVSPVYEDPTVNKKRSNEIGTREKCGQIFVCFKNGFRSIKDAEER